MPEHVWLKTGCSELQHTLDMPTRDPRKPLNKLVDSRPIFEVFKERSNGHSRARKHPGPTQCRNVALNGLAIFPRTHAVSLRRHARKVHGSSLAASTTSRLNLVWFACENHAHQLVPACVTIAPRRCGSWQPSPLASLPACPHKAAFLWRVSGGEYRRHRPRLELRRRPCRQLRGLEGRCGSPLHHAA